MGAQKWMQYQYQYQKHPKIILAVFVIKTQKAFSELSTSSQSENQSHIAEIIHCNGNGVLLKTV